MCNNNFNHKKKTHPDPLHEHVNGDIDSILKSELMFSNTQIGGYLVLTCGRIKDSPCKN